jgi:hypothetical protein
MTHNGNDGRLADPTASAAIKRPVPVVERIRLRLEHFYAADRVSVPDTFSDEITSHH